MTMFMNYPLYINEHGRTAQVPLKKHIKQLLEQLLFTSPRERVNRPNFGTGLKQLVFAPIGDELSTAYQFIIQGAIQQWLGDLIRVIEIKIETLDSTSVVTVCYLIMDTQETIVEQFSNAVSSN
jgi:phage baseplate assembly protein W